MLAINCERDVEEIVGQQEERDEDDGLNEAATGGGFRPVAKLGGETEREDCQQRRDAIDLADEV